MYHVCPEPKARAANRAWRDAIVKSAERILRYANGTAPEDDLRFGFAITDLVQLSKARDLANEGVDNVLKMSGAIRQKEND